MSTKEVGEEALLNIRRTVKGYNLCRFEVNIGELFTANKKSGQLGHLPSKLVDPLWPLHANISVK